MSETIIIPGSRITLQDWNWLVHNRDKGNSSLAMFSHIILKMNHFKSHPLDVDDYLRCQDLMRIIPWVRENLDLMSEVSPTWAALVARWQDICHLIRAGQRTEADELIRRICLETKGA